MSNYFVHMTEIESFSVRLTTLRRGYNEYCNSNLIDKLSRENWLYENYRCKLNIIYSNGVSGVNGLYFESESDYLLFLLKTK